MSRHRDIRNLDYDEEYDEACDEDVYGHSVDDGDYGVSPGMEQYLYSRSRENTHGFGLYLPVEDNIKEEEESFENSALESPGIERSRHDSSSYQKPSLSSEDEVRLESVLDEMRNILGDQFSERELIQTVLKNNFELDASINELLNKNSTSDSAQPLPQRERRVRNRVAANAASAFVEQLSLCNSQQQSQQAASNHLSTKASSSIQTPMPVVVTTSAKKGETSRVVRGFDVLDAEESAAAENNLVAEEEEAKRSRSCTPVRGGKDKDREKDKETSSYTRTPAKIRDKEVNVLAEYNEQRASGKELLNLVVVGHVDAGKSTLMGHLLYLKGNVGQRVMHKYEQESKKIGKQSFMYAWVLDDTDEERSRGVTVDVAQRMFESDTKIVTLLDAPGHRDFIPNMITGAARADVAIVVIDATTGAFEAGFESGGQTREHAILIRSLGVSQIVVAVNKLDTVEWNQDRFVEVKSGLRQFLKTVGFKDADVVYIPCSGLTGENLVKPCSDEKLCSWYSGSTLIQAIDGLKVPERGVSRPVRMCISDVYKGQGSNMCVGGRLDTGYVQNGDRLLLLPQGNVLNVKGVQADNAAPSTAFAGDHVTLTLGGVDPSVLHIGDFLCDPTKPIPLVNRCQARIVVFNIAVPLIRGTQVDFHYLSVTEPAKIRKLVSQLHKTTGQIVKNKPRALVKNSAALIELEFTRPLCLELFRDFKELGRFMLRTGGSTIAAGLVTQLLD
ncbi:HBS1-like protein [Halocaridina rubra]|uniref:HBS1-like protein n=1 Tax=Halocaridina rubra TaxID=373956 RepID=A0AAN8XFB3_HALRR